MVFIARLVISLMLAATWGCTIPSRPLPTPIRTTVVLQSPAATPEPTPTLQPTQRATVAARPAMTPVATVAIRPAMTPVPEPEPATVQAVISGDTIRVRMGDGTIETVRYAGVEAPTGEGEACYSREAIVRNALLVDGENISLEISGLTRDAAGLLLHYVWVRGDDNGLRLVNEELVKWGFARASTYPPGSKYEQLFQAREQEARADKRGLWGVCPE